MVQEVDPNNNEEDTSESHEEFSFDVNTSFEDEASVEDRDRSFDAFFERFLAEHDFNEKDSMSDREFGPLFQAYCLEHDLEELDISPQKLVDLFRDYCLENDFDETDCSEWRMQEMDLDLDDELRELVNSMIG